MKEKIAILSDIHGNQTALEAVIADTQKEQVTTYWVLGDILMPGTGRQVILDLLRDLPISIQLRGNWEDSLWRACQGELDLQRPSHLYLTRLAQYLLEEISLADIAALQQFPLHTTVEVAGLKIALSHHLPDKNWGRELIHTGKQSDFDRLFEGNDCAVAVYGHIHQPFLRYGSHGQLIVNPGSIGQPFFLDKTLRQDLRAQYAILEIDKQGLADVCFKRVDYDIEKELKLGHSLGLPYVEVYAESLLRGVHHTHNHALLEKIAHQEGYLSEVKDYFKMLS